MNYYIGWDVGAWRCTKSSGKSCDAIVVMNDEKMLGHFRNNISELIASLSSCEDALKARHMIDYVFDKCKVQENPANGSEFYFSVDTPLGWPKGFKKLLHGALPSDWTYDGGDSDLDNPLLYRRTEQILKSGFSVVAQSIGSQSTKGMSLISALGTVHEEWGVWRKGNITLIETYPKACLLSGQFVAWMSTLNLEYDVREWAKPIKKKDQQEDINQLAEKILLIQDDTFDAAVCACLARAFANKTPPLVQPPITKSDEDKQEGWIFYPAGELISKSLADSHSLVTNSAEAHTFAMAVKAFQSHVLTPKTKKAKTQATEDLPES